MIDTHPSLAPLKAFLARFDALVAQSKWEEGPLSNRLLGASDRVAEIRRTKSDIGVKRLAKAEADLARLAAEAGVVLPQAVENADSVAVAERNGAAA